MATPETTPPASPTPAPDGGSRWTAARVVGMVLASVAGLLGLLLLLLGLALVAVHVFVRDSDGYLSPPSEELETPTYALTAEEIDLGADPADWAPEELLGTVRLSAESSGGEPVFVGIGPQNQVDAYLRGVAHAEVSEFDDDEPRYEVSRGDAPSGPPGAEGFWVARSEGSGERTVFWGAEAGLWAIVVMNADADRGVAVDADVAVRIGWLLAAGLVLAGVGLLLLVTGVISALAVGRRASRDRASPAQ